MGRQVAKPLLYPAASENETEYENLKFEGSLVCNASMRVKMQKQNGLPTP